MGRYVSLVYGVVCYLIFFVTFLYLIGFLGNFLVPKGIDDGTTGSLAITLLANIGLIALFGLQHSVMARPAFKAWWTKLVPARVERSTYVLIASLALVLLYWQWRPMTQIVWQADAAWSQAVLWGLFGAGFVLVLLSTFVIDHFDLFGLRQVYLHFVSEAYTHPGFGVTYFYKFVRHPIYLGWLLAFWGTPTMTIGHWLFAVGMSSYIVIAIRYEERDLEALLGEDYRRYRDRTPMLIPWPGKIHATVKAARPVRAGRTTVMPPGTR